ncbi:MAG: class I SAM-dependent methyltransferase, partial [Beijerinckiaceae bacterium]
QGDFLRALVIDQRAARLMAASPGKSADIASQRDRLTEMTPTGMGRLFKVLAITPPGGRPPAGFG